MTNRRLSTLNDEDVVVLEAAGANVETTRCIVLARVCCARRRAGGTIRYCPAPDAAARGCAAGASSTRALRRFVARGGDRRAQRARQAERGRGARRRRGARSACACARPTSSSRITCCSRATAAPTAPTAAAAPPPRRRARRPGPSSACSAARRSTDSGRARAAPARGGRRAAVHGFHSAVGLPEEWETLALRSGRVRRWHFAAGEFSLAGRLPPVRPNACTGLFNASLPAFAAPARRAHANVGHDLLSSASCRCSRPARARHAAPLPRAGPPNGGRRRRRRRWARRRRPAAPRCRGPRRRSTRRSRCASCSRRTPRCGSSSSREQGRRTGASRPRSSGL